MGDYEFTEHARDMLRERGIDEAWVRAVLDYPEITEPQSDGTLHYIRRTPEHGQRYLRVVVNPGVRPQRVVTVFFDRRLRSRQ